MFSPTRSKATYITTILVSITGLMIFWCSAARADLNSLEEPPVPIFAQRFHVGSVDGLSWIPQGGQCEAIVVCLHGVSMWSGSFGQFGNDLAKMNIATYALDIPGFGPCSRIDEKWAKVDPSNAVPASELVLDDLHRRYPGKPVYLLGESMGGSIAIRVASRYPGQINGIICSAPAWRLCKRKRTIFRAIFAVLSGSESRFDDVVATLINRATNSPELHKRWQTNPEYRFRFSLCEILRGMSFFAHTGRYAPMITKTPVLMIQGLNDRLVKAKGSAILLKRMPISNKELVLLNGSGHLIFQEVAPSPEVIEVIADWIKQESTEELSENERIPRGMVIGTCISKGAKKLFHQAGIDNPSLFDSSMVGASRDGPLQGAAL